MIYAASSHSSAVLRKQASSRQSLNDKPNTSRSSSSASYSKRLVISAPRPGTANGFKARRPNTPEKSNTRLKELKEIFHLTEKDLHDFYRVFCFFWQISKVVRARSLLGVRGKRRKYYRWREATMPWQISLPRSAYRQIEVSLMQSGNWLVANRKASINTGTNFGEQA